MSVVNRSFGRTRDAVAGGSDYDAIQAQAGAAAGVIPQPTEFWPVKGGGFNKNIERNSRADEIRGFPSAPPEQPWKARPSFDAIPVPGYFDIVARVMQEAMGGTPTRTGTAPAAFTDTFYALPLGSSTEAPRFHVSLIRDTLIYRASGAVINQFNLDLPADDDASIEVGMMGLFYQQRSSGETQPTPSFSLPVRTLRLADVSAFIDGSLTKVPNVIAAGLQFQQDYDPKFYAGRNRVPDPAAPCFYVHFPGENKRRANRTINPRLTLGQTDEAEEFKQDFARVEKLVFELLECAMTTTPVATRLIRITVPASVWTDGGADPLNRTDDINSPFTGTAAYSETDGYDLKVEVVHNTSTLFTA